MSRGIGVMEFIIRQEELKEEGFRVSEDQIKSYLVHFDNRVSTLDPNEFYPLDLSKVRINLINALENLKEV